MSASTNNKTAITVEAIVNAPVESVWEKWNNPEDIKQWCFASEEWHAPHSENNLVVGGKLSTTMAAKDGSMSFDFWGIYTSIEQYRRIDYTLGDDRKVSILFTPEGAATKVTETFEAEDSNSIELQQAGWQAILDNFRKHVEAQ